MALYRDSSLTRTRDKWAAAHLAGPDLLWAARHQIPNNHSPRRAAATAGALNARASQRAWRTPNVLGTGTGI
jgi:hypothetical protein